jgi:predicted nucleic acid-binding protein
MKVPKIYLETTIFNFPFADDAPQYKADTLKLFDEIKAGKFKPYTSEYVLEELNNERNIEKRKKMLARY